MMEEQLRDKKQLREKQQHKEKQLRLLQSGTHRRFRHTSYLLYHKLHLSQTSEMGRAVSSGRCVSAELYFRYPSERPKRRKTNAPCQGLRIRLSVFRGWVFRPSPMSLTTRRFMIPVNLVQVPSFGPSCFHPTDTPPVPHTSYLAVLFLLCFALLCGG